MSLSTAQDINVIVIVPDTTFATDPSAVLVRTERRINPSWTVEQLKTKLEPITGIPSSSQSISTNDSSVLSPDTAILSQFHLRKYSELLVHDLRPPRLRQNLTDLTTVEKYEMPPTQYEQLPDSVLAWKRRQQLGRFDPHAKSADQLAEERRANDTATITTKQIIVGQRCRVGGEDERRGTVRFVGEIDGLGGDRERGCVWVGVELDEPVGRNDGSVNVTVSNGKGTETKRVFECKPKFGVFARPDKVEVGDWPPLDDWGVDDDDNEGDMEEI